MCTAAVYKTKDFYFGRTLDYDYSYGDEVTITPRSFNFCFKYEGVISSHNSIIGMAHVADNYPLYYDAVNEKGLAMAGLNFTGNAAYKIAENFKYNIAPFELIPWILSQCSSVTEAKALISKTNIIDVTFNGLPQAQLHWIIAGHNEAITVESTKDGINIYDNKVGILTNNPPFNMQLFNLNNYMSLSAKEPHNSFCSSLPLYTYSRGMGAIGLPGDLSSQSRFVRAAFVRTNSVSGDSEEESVNQFFHILGSVEQQRGCCSLGYGNYEVTLYTSCCNTDKGIYYYTTYENHQITKIDMHNENLNDSSLIRYPLIRSEQIRLQN